MANANVVALQNAINRYANVAGFPLLVVDGGMGINTANGLLKALGWIVRDGCGPQEVCVSDSTQETATSLISAVVSDNGPIDQTKIMQSNIGLTTFLNNAADTIGLPFRAGPAPIVNVPGAANVATNVQLPMISTSWSASLINKFKALATWQKVALGAAAGLGILYVHKRYQESHGLSGIGGPGDRLTMKQVRKLRSRLDRVGESDLRAGECRKVAPGVKLCRNVYGHYRLA